MLHTCIVIGTTSATFGKHLKMLISAHYHGEIFIARTEMELRRFIEMKKPYLLLIDSCSWQSATHLQVHGLISQRGIHTPPFRAILRTGKNCGVCIPRIQTIPCGLNIPRPFRARYVD
jgi:hypothetical protein